MLKIRLQRVGRKNVPVFRIVVTDSRNSTKSGKYLEVIGNFDPVYDKKEADAERVRFWISKGAKPTDTLHNFFIDKKILQGKKVNALPRKRPVKPDAESAAAKGGEPGKESAPAASPAGGGAASAGEPDSAAKAAKK